MTKEVGEKTFRIDLDLKLYEVQGIQQLAQEMSLAAAILGEAGTHELTSRLLRDGSHKLSWLIRNIKHTDGPQ